MVAIVGLASLIWFEQHKWTRYWQKLWFFESWLQMYQDNNNPQNTVSSLSFVLYEFLWLSPSCCDVFVKYFVDSWKPENAGGCYEQAVCSRSLCIIGFRCTEVSHSLSNTSHLCPSIYLSIYLSIYPSIQPLRSFTCWHRLSSGLSYYYVHHIRKTGLQKWPWPVSRIVVSTNDLL